MNRFFAITLCALISGCAWFDDTRAQLRKLKIVHAELVERYDQTMELLERSERELQQWREGAGENIQALRQQLATCMQERVEAQKALEEERASRGETERALQALQGDFRQLQQQQLQSEEENGRLRRASLERLRNIQLMFESK